MLNVFYQIKSSLYSPYYAEACNELRGPSPRLSAWATQLRRNVATVASRWRHCADLTGPGIEPQTSRTESERFATELTAGVFKHKLLYKTLNGHEYSWSCYNNCRICCGFNLRMGSFVTTVDAGVLAVVGGVVNRGGF